LLIDVPGNAGSFLSLLLRYPLSSGRRNLVQRRLLGGCLMSESVPKETALQGLIKAVAALNAVHVVAVIV